MVTAVAKPLNDRVVNVWKTCYIADAKPLIELFLAVAKPLILKYIDL
jgi:hypothetical protein